MEIKKTPDPVPGNHRRTPLLFVLAVFLLLAMIAAAFYLSFSRTAIINQQVQLDTEIKSLDSQILALKGQNIEVDQLSRKYLQNLEKNEIHWSEVIKSVKTLVPVDTSTQKPKIHFLSYSGSPGGKLSLNAETIPAPRAPFFDVSELLSTFNNSSFFKNAYIPSINRGISDTGNVLLSFTFNVTYNDATTTSIATPPETSSSVSTPTATSVLDVAPTSKVPRR